MTNEQRATDEISRAEWLQRLAPVDNRLISWRNAFDLVKVVRRTKSGRIVVPYGRGEKEFNPDGSGRGGGPYDYASLEMPTQAQGLTLSGLQTRIFQKAEKNIPLGTIRRYWYGTKKGNASGEPLDMVSLTVLRDIALALGVTIRELIEETQEG